jgi:zinc transport system substrate-binding protein
MALSCQKKEEKQPGLKKLKIVTTLFPLYDFTKNIGGKHADVSLLLPPGVEPHSFEPKPEDIARINKADVFIYTGKHMEPWAENILKGIDNKNLMVIDAGKGLTLIEETEEQGHDHKHDKKHEEELDPHIWLDFSNAQKMADAILDGIAKTDAANKDLYIKNAGGYKAKLADLDKRFKDGLSNCKSDVFIHGGHFAFGYLAKRYNLEYLPAYKGFSPNAEPTPKRLKELVDKLRKRQLKHVFYEELISPRIADTIARETGASLLRLHGAHNLTKEEMNKGLTFISIMEQNLNNLRLGLECK